MTTNEERMSASRSAGYILGVGLGFVRHYYKLFALLVALTGLAIILASVLTGRAFIGILMIAVGFALWFIFRPSKQ